MTKSERERAYVRALFRARYPVYAAAVEHACRTIAEEMATCRRLYTSL
jgi:hypothetical protein